MKAWWWLCFLWIGSSGYSHEKLKSLSLAYIGERPAGLVYSPRYLKVVEEGVSLAIDLRKEEFKKLGYDLQVKFYHSLGTGLPSFKATYDALRGDTVAAVGLGTSDEAVVAAQALRKTAYTVVSPFATSDELLKDYPNVALMSGPNSSMAQACEQFISRRFPGKKVAAVVPWDSAFSRNFYEMFSESFRKKTQLVKTQEKFLNTHQVVVKTLAAQPEVVLIPSFPIYTGTLIHAFVEGGYKGIFVGPDSWGEGTDNRLSMMLRNVKFQGYAVRQFSSFNRTPEQKRLIGLLASRTGLAVPSQGLLYFDAANYLLDILRDLKTDITRERVFEEVKKRRSYDGTEGHYCLSALDCPGRKYLFLSVKDGHFSFGGYL